jgi:ABC-type transporter Mla MlaB component
VGAAKSSSIEFVVGGRIDRADVSRLCDALRLLLEPQHVELVICDVGALVRPDAVAVDLLARLQLTARWRGAAICLRDASAELCELIVFMGLCAAMSSSVTGG